MKTRVVLIAAIIIASFIQLEAKYEAKAMSRGILYVGGTGANNYTKIQDAIDNASDGDTIFVYSGIYYENIVINKKINLIGEDKNTTIIDGNYSGSVIAIYAEGASVKGFTIRNNGMGWWNAGIKISTYNNTICNNIIYNNSVGISIYLDNNIICNNTIYNNSYGLLFIYAYSNKVYNNDIHNNTQGLRLWNSGGNIIHNNTFLNDGIVVVDSYNNVVVNNTINGKPIVYLENDSDMIVSNGGQIIVVSCHNITIKNLILSNTDFCLQLIDTNNCTISNNIMYGCQALWIDSSNNNVICNNTIYNTSYGIWFYCSNDNFVYNNTLYNNTYGTWFYFSHNNVITSCNYYNNEQAIYFYYYSSNNYIINCSIHNNYNGVYFYLSYTNNITECHIFNNSYGINVSDSNYNAIYECNISNNNDGIILYCSSNNIILNNTFFNEGILIYGESLNEYIHFIENNTVNNLPLLYFKNKNNVILNGVAGEIIIVNCSEFEINNINISHTDIGIQIAFSRNITISNCNISNNVFGTYIYKSVYRIRHSSFYNNEYGIKSDENLFSLIENNTIGFNQYGIYRHTEKIYREISQASYTWTNIGIPRNASYGEVIDDYGNYTMHEDDGYFIYKLPFVFPFMNRSIVNISVNTNGLIELLEEGETPYEEDDYGTHEDGDHINNMDAIFASNDDLETEDGYLAVFNFGDKVVIEWYGSTYSDYDSSTNPVHFQVVLYENGTIEWNFKKMEFSSYDHDMFSGAYAKEENVEFIAGYAINETSSYKANLSTMPSDTNISEVAFRWTNIGIPQDASNGEVIDDYGNYVMHEDDGYFIYKLPFVFPFMNRSIVNISVNTNGLIELLEEGETPYEEDDYGTHEDGDHINNMDAIFASNDDLETEDGYLAVFNFGDKVVIEWYGSTYSDYDSSTNPVHFQVVLYENGTIEWNFKKMEFSSYDHDMFSGAYAKEESVEFIVGYAINETSSYKANLSTIPSDIKIGIIRNNTIVGNEIGILLKNESLNLIYNNYFKNIKNAWDNGNNIWNIEKTFGKNIIGGNYIAGNYWDDYEGKDINGDGIGDEFLPYNCSGNIVHGGDYMPLVKAYYIPITYLPSGWSLFGLPFNETISLASLIVKYNNTYYTWNEAVTNGYVLQYVYTVNRTTGMYEVVNQLKPSYGYWIYCYESIELYVNESFENGDYIDASTGWNLVALPCNNNVSLNNLTIVHDGNAYTWNEAVTNGYVLQYVYTIDRNTGSYTTINELVPGYGYWLYCYEDVIIKI